MRTHFSAAVSQRSVWAFAIALVGSLVWTGPVMAHEAGTPTTGVTASPTAGTPDLDIVEASVRYLRDLDLLVFDLEVNGEAGATTPKPHGTLDGAPVIGYVVPTTLPPSVVGFRTEEGLVGLAITSHPDFDDTPFWDENADGDYNNDGVIWHAHWVLLGEDERAPGGLAVRAVANSDAGKVLPPTSPGLPLYLDSPGFPVQLGEGSLRVVVPAPRVGNETAFKFDAVTAYLQVNTSDEDRPMLGVYDVYGVLSGDLSLPYEVEEVEE